MPGQLRFLVARLAGIAAFGIALVCVGGGRGSADSLYPVKKVNQALANTPEARAFLFSDSRAHAVGDILTVTVTENTSAQSSAATKAAKDENINAFGGSGLFQRLLKDFSFGANSSRANNGSGQTTRSGSLTTTLSVLVAEVMPNGNLRIEGSRIVGINKETQKVTFAGIVRPQDILPDNSISSSLVAGVTVSYDGKGTVGDTQRIGLLTRLFHLIF